MLRPSTCSRGMVGDSSRSRAHGHTEQVAGLERAATWLSLGCALHCLATPLLAAGLPLAGASASFVHHPVLEVGLSALVLIGVLLTAVLGYRRHRDVRVLVALGAGLVLYLLGHVGDGWPSRVVSIAGALSLSVASVASARLSHTHSEHCAH